MNKAIKTIILALPMIFLTANNQADPDQDPAADQTNQADTCLGGQSADLEDLDISKCPSLPTLPEDAQLGESGPEISLGAWELGQTAEGDVYKYGSLTEATDGLRNLEFYGEDGSTAVNEGNLDCWAKGYYRLRQILQNPPENYLRLHAAGFQVRFFQFQTDLRNGTTGFKEIASYRDHLVKWVTVIEEDGTCVLPTLTKFKNYVEAELVRRELDN